jgi:omega-6 fatty acid desaturase (delta-12 desaturase)
MSNTNPTVVLDSLPKIIRKIPSDCLESSALRSVYYLVRDLSMALLLVYGIANIQSWIFGPILALVLGFVLTGLFVVGHDAGHRSFSKSTKLNDFVGHLTMSLTYWPFHVWRLSHDIHHRYTHNIDRDIAWVPFTYEKYQTWPSSMQRLYLWTRSSFFFIGSVFFTSYFVKDALRGQRSKHFKKTEQKQIQLSLAVMFLWMVLSFVGAIYFYGIYGFVCFVLLPQLGFHFWLSTFTLFHHTHNEVNFMPAESWSPEKAQLGSTIHVDYPFFVEWLCHDINWHVPHHVCVGVPHYHLRRAHQALKTFYPEIVREEKISFSLVKNVIEQCQFIKSKTPPDMTWISKAEKEQVLRTLPEPSLMG